MARSTLPTECDVCNDEYDDDERCPRIFDCFHTLCNKCEKLINANNKRCPFCRKQFQAKLAKEVMVNHGMLDLIKYIAQRESKLKESDKGLRINQFKEELVEAIIVKTSKCQQVKKKIEETHGKVMTLQNSIVEENKKIESEILTRIHEVILQKKTLEGLRQTGNMLQKEIEEIKDKEKQLGDARAKLEAMTENTNKEIYSRLAESEDIIDLVEECTRNAEKVIDREETIIKITNEQVTKSLKKAKLLKDFLESSVVMAENPSPSTELHIINQQYEDLSRQISVEELISMPLSIKRMIDQGKMFAVLHKDERKYHARITLYKKRKLLIHPLTDNQVPTDSLQLKHDELMSLVDPASRLTFLKLKNRANNTNLGTLFIRLSSDSQIAKKFANYCLGINGTSYEGMTILSIFGRGEINERIIFGNSEEDIRYPVTYRDIFLVPFYTSGYDQQWLEGSVTARYSDHWVDERAGQFEIFPSNNLCSKLCACFGRVEEGLGVLKQNLPRSVNPCTTVISDCGIVLFTR